MSSGKEDDKAEPEMKDNIISENQQKTTELLHSQEDEGSVIIMCITNMSLYGQLE